MGFEPTLTAWKAVDLAINLYPHNFNYINYIKTYKNFNN